MNNKKWIPWAVVGVLAVAAAIALLRSGGGQAPVVPRVSATYICRADITYGDMALTLGLEKSGPGRYGVDFLEPQLLAGMRIDLEDGQITLSYNGMSFTVTAENQPGTAAASMLIAALDQLTRHDAVTAERRGEGIEAKGHISVGDFVAAFDADGQLLSVDIPSLQFSASIYGMREAN